MIRLLFVDDDADVLAGLRNRLRSQRSRWEMVFVQSGYEALDELEQSPFDVIVSDMRMPMMDGAELLAKVKERYPDVARIILSGDAERDAVLRALPIVHQFLSKPCDGNVLKAAIERACLQRAILCDSRLQELMAQLTRPALPAVYQACLRALHGSSSDCTELARLLSEDPRLSGDVIRLATAALLGPVETLAPLVVQSLAIAASLFVPVAGDPPWLAELPARAVRRARLARALAPSDLAESAFAAGLLGVVGPLLLARALPERWAALESDPAGAAPVAERERAAFGAAAWEVSAVVVSEWMVSPAVVEVLAFVERTEVEALGKLELLVVLQVAHALTRSRGEQELPEALRRRADAQLPRWREVAAHELAVRP